MHLAANTLFNRVFIIVIAVITILIASLANSAIAQGVQSRAELSHRSISQEGIGANLTIKPEQGWHVYWKYPGDSGATLKTSWGCDGATPHGSEVLTRIEPLSWPIPQVISVGPLVNYGFERDVTLPFMIGCDAATTKRVTLDAEWLVCKEECIPQFGTLELFAPWNNASELTALPELSHQLHLPSSQVLRLSAQKEGLTVIAKIPETEENKKMLSSGRFIPDSGGQIINAANQTVSNGELKIALYSEEVKNLSGLLVFSSTVAYPVQIQIQGKMAELWPVLLAAFIGGVLLNVMPCVFPVLGLKIYQLVSSKPHERMVNSLLYALGVCLSMLIVGGGIGLLRANGVGVGWGTQLQNPYVVYSLVLVFVLLGCNLLGLFEVGSQIQSATGRIKIAGPLMDGLLTVLVATPCTAPFMAGAIAVAFGLPTFSQLLVFAFLGLGVSAPVLLVGAVPGISKFLPRPGGWMELFKKLLAWPLFASAAWLLTVLIALVGVEHATISMLGVVALGFFIWIFSVFRPHGLIKLLFISVSLLVLGFTYPGKKPIDASSSIKHVVYSKEELSRLRAQRVPVFLDATAAWCITCQSNKQLVLRTEAVSLAMKSTGVVWMEADWTEPSEEITSLLSEYGRAGVPLNVFFPPNKEPVVFPPLLTSTMVLEALSR